MEEAFGLAFPLPGSLAAGVDEVHMEALCHRSREFQVFTGKALSFRP
jgi:hypothetical protein